MSWRIEAAMTLLLAGPQHWLGRMSKTGQSLAVLGSLFVGGLVVAFGAGAWYTTNRTEFGTHPQRIQALEDWRTAHEDTVTEPGLARINRLEARSDALEERWEEDIGMIRDMTWQLYCDRFPARCEARPSRENGG